MARPTRVAEMDVRPGGKWRFVSAGPDREDVEFYGEYLEVVEPERIKWTFMFDVEGVGPQGGPETLTLEDLGDGRTQMRAVSHMGSEERSSRARNRHDRGRHRDLGSPGCASLAELTESASRVPESRTRLVPVKQV